MMSAEFLPEVTSTFFYGLGFLAWVCLLFLSFGMMNASAAILGSASAGGDKAWGIIIGAVILLILPWYLLVKFPEPLLIGLSNVFGIIMMIIFFIADVLVFIF